MSDYISKSALEKYLRDYKWEFALGSDFSKAIEMVDVQPTLDEKEIISKTFERVLERLEKRYEYLDAKVKEYEQGNYMGSARNFSFMRSQIDLAIEIVKEECGISE